MAITWNQRQHAHLRAYETRFTTEMGQLAARIGQVLLRFSVGSSFSQRVIPAARRVQDQVTAAIWSEVLKPYFIGNGDQPLIGPIPQSPYARLIVSGIEGAIRIQAERQIVIIRRSSKNDPVVTRWLTQNPPTVREQYDPFHRFVYGDKPYVLSTRIWNAAMDAQARVNELLAYEIAEGTPAVDIAELLDAYLTYPAQQIKTRKPYGSSGSYAARRLARTEITANAGRSVIAMANANPYVDGIDWALSARHPKPDVCDPLASIDMAGGRVREPYPINRVPNYPPHPHCLCTLRPRASSDIAAITRNLRTRIDRREPEMIVLRGVFDLEWVVSALMSGLFADWLDEVLN